MKYIYILIGLSIINSSCKKFLDVPQNKSWDLPSSMEDLQLLMDDYNKISSGFPVSSEEISDNIFQTTDELKSAKEENRNLYLWQKEDRLTTSWTYAPLLTINTVLDEFNKLESQAIDKEKANTVKGSALFLRAYYFYGIAQIYAPPYTKATANDLTGIPLRTDPDFLTVSKRSTLQQTYDRITEDLKLAASLLPVTPFVKTRPSKPAAFGALARTYLAMGEYALAGQYADSCLKYESRLMDYNDVTTLSANVPFQRFTNPEVIFHIRSSGSTFIGTVSKIDSTLYRSFDANDLRKTGFFRTQGTSGFYRFKGDYDGAGSGNYVFAGIVTDEMYLIRAESYARAGEYQRAMDDLNALLVKRWRKNTFTKLVANNAKEAMGFILTERRKELIGRGARWVDLRRLKDDPDYAVTPKRVYDGQTYTLAANNPRYTMLFPLIVIQKSGMPQNP